MAIKRLPLALVRAVSVEITMNGGNESSWYGNRELGIGNVQGHVQIRGVLELFQVTTW